MNLKQVRTWFIRESGRYDLVVDTTDYIDNGADNFLNAGQRMLDRLQTTPFTEGHNWQQALVNVKHVVFPLCRAIKSVFATKVSDSSRTELIRWPLKEIKKYHFDTTIDAGTPLYYAPGVFRLAPETTQAIGDIDVPSNYLDYIGESAYKYNGILFTPACDETYAIEVWAYFYSPQLTSDTQETFWTSEHPELLVMAGQCMLEKFSRNTEGVKDWMNAIKQELQGIDFDLVEEDVVDSDQMEG